MKVAFIDLDGVIADCTKRLELAQMAKDHYQLIVQNELDSFSGNVKKELEALVTGIYWQTVFDPDLVSMDTPIPGAAEGLARIEAEGYRIILLSSRIEAMRVETYKWLERHGMKGDGYGFRREMVLVAPAFKNDYVKTVTWKIGIIQQLTALFEIEEVLLVDDTPAIRAALDNAGMPFLFQVREAL